MTDRFTAKVLRGAEALEYAKHLRKAGVDAERWEIEYIDEGTGDRWLLDYPESERHGGGSPRLPRSVSLRIIRQRSKKWRGF
jgi:hypothetical protein